VVDLALFEAIVLSSHDAIVAIDVRGTILSWNPGAERLYGFAAAEAIGRSVDDLIPPEKQSDEAYIRSIVAAGAHVDRYRTLRIRADGRTVAVSIGVSPLAGPDGRPLGVTTIARGVSDREKAESQVQAVLDATPDALLGVDVNSRVVLVNREAERLFGLRRFQLVELPVERLLPDGLPRPTIFANDPAAATRERTAIREDGTKVPVEISLSALRTDDGPLIVVAIRDVTEQQRLREEAEKERLEARMQRTQRLESLGQLAGGVAHDFNNLLAVILNYAAFIIEDGAGTPFAADAEQIARAGRRGSELTHQLLAFARREVIRPRPLDVNAVVREVQQMLSRSIGEHIALGTHLALTVPPVMADPGQLEQVLVNLAVNARDAMPSGGQLTIDTNVVDVDGDHAAVRGGLAPGRYVRLRVSDTGTGMPKDVVDRAFDPFFTTKPSGEGTGLGLATVYGIVTQAGGTVHIYSEPGLGTTISVLLPATSEQPTEQAEWAADRDLRGQGQTVLVVEDEAALRQVTSRILRRGGYTVLVAEDGPDALRIAGEHPEPIDVLVTDVIMPGMLGKEVAQRVTGIRPQIKVLYMSGYAQPVLASHGTLDPDVYLLEKPFTSIELLAAVQDLYLSP
jgi:PAS domain S-box-containing protein